MSDSVTPWTVAYQASSSTGFSRQEYRSALPFPSPGDLPDPGIEPKSPISETDALTSEPPGKCTKGKWLSEEALQIAKRRSKGKGEKERYIHLDAEFQRIARRDKKAFLVSVVSFLALGNLQ